MSLRNDRQRMSIIGYILYVILSFIVLLMLLPLAPLIALVGFPGIGGVMAGVAAAVALFLVRLFAAVNPWVCFAIFAVEQFMMMPRLVNPRGQVSFALVTLAVAILVFF